MNETLETRVLPSQIALSAGDRLPEGYGTLEGGLAVEVVSTGEHVYMPAHRDEDGRTYFFVQDRMLSCPTEVDTELFCRPGNGLQGLMLVARKGISQRMRAYEEALKDYREQRAQGKEIAEPQIPPRFVAQENEIARRKYFPNLAHVRYRL